MAKTESAGSNTSGWGSMLPRLHAQHVRCVRNLLNLGSPVLAATYIRNNVRGREREILMLALQSVADIRDLERALQIQEP